MNANNAPARKHERHTEHAQRVRAAALRTEDDPGPPLIRPSTRKSRHPPTGAPVLLTSRSTMNDGSEKPTAQASHPQTPQEGLVLILSPA